MDELFKQKLLSLRDPKSPSSFDEALYGDLVSCDVKPLDPGENNSEQFTEKQQVLESLERFAKEKFSNLPGNDEKIISVDGGVLAQKPEPGWMELVVPKTIEALLSQLSLSESVLKLSLNKKLKNGLKVIFVSEQFRNWDEISPELSQSFVDEILPAFPLKISEYFGRMVQAMKLEVPEILLYPCENEEKDISDEIALIAGFFRPEVIITLGAKATHRMLKNQERLAVIHGQFFQRRIGDTSVTIVPLFHPAIIENNVNMKKTAWGDMQKIMKHLKKFP